MSGRTLSCGRLTAGLTKVSPLRLNLLYPLWAPNGWPQLLLWAPDGWLHGGSRPHRSFIPSTPTYLLPFPSDHLPDISVRLGGGGLWLDHLPRAHLHLRRSTCLCRRHVRRQIWIRSGPPSFYICSCPRFPRGIPVLRCRQTSSFYSSPP